MDKIPYTLTGLSAALVKRLVFVVVLATLNGAVFSHFYWLFYYDYDPFLAYCFAAAVAFIGAALLRFGLD